MQWLFETPQLSLGDAQQDLMQKKLEKLDKFLPPSAVQGEVVLREENLTRKDQRYKADIMLSVGDVFLRSSKLGPTLEAAFDEAWDSFKLQLSRFKSKLKDKRSKVAEGEEMAILGEARQLRRQKKLDIQPMHADAAIEQMELLDHDFFLFRDVDSKMVNLVYRRQDGHYGLLEVEA